MQLDLVEGNITGLAVDVIVTAANSALAGGGGVDGAVHRACGPRLVQASRALAPCPAGSAVLTPAFDLSPPVSWVVHAVGPVWHGGQRGEPASLASAYASALARADAVGARSIAFPAISTGVYGYPPDQAAQVAVTALRAALTTVELCLLVAFDRTAARLYRSLLG